jgi:diguanylate cyclase (GGDEF)-like protein
LVHISSTQPDEHVLAALDRSERHAKIIATTIAVIVLALWFVPSLRDFAPSIWSKMVANTAILVTLSVLGLVLAEQQRSIAQLRLSRCVGILVALSGALFLLEYIYGTSIGIDVWMPHDSAATFSGRPSLQASVCFLLVGINILLVRAYKSRVSILADVFALSLLALVLVLFGGYAFNALELVSTAKSNVISPHTLMCLSCIAFIITSRRARSGEALSVLVNVGQGSRMVRALLPAALVFPYGFRAALVLVISSGILSAPYARAFSSAVEAFFILGIVIWMAWRINSMERELVKLSLIDELTKINNRRGFYLLAQQMFRTAARAGTDVTIFYFDIDGLKRANDTAGHEAGSRMIQSVATILLGTFRDSDVIGRVGGDEFAVAASGSFGFPPNVLERLRLRASEINETADPNCQIAFSAGYAVWTGGDKATFEELLAKADAMMYEQKTNKRMLGR